MKGFTSIDPVTILHMKSSRCIEDSTLNVRLSMSDISTDFLPALEGRGFPSRGLIVPTIGSGLHPSFGGQSSGSENHSHLALGVWRYLPQRGLSLPSSSPLKKRRDDWCSSHSPIKPSIELGRSVISITKRNFGKEVFKYKGAIHPR